MTREGQGEALTGDHIGQPLSRDNLLIPSADTFRGVEGNTQGRAMRVPERLGAVVDPGMCRRTLYGNREILVLAGSGTPVRIGKARSHSR